MLRNMFSALLLFALLGVANVQTKGAQNTNLALQDSLKLEQRNDSVIKKNIFQKLIAYFDESNVEKEEKVFDVSFIGGPHYSSDSKFGLGVVASGLYRVDRSDKSISPSNISLYGDVTTTGSYVIGIRSNTIFPEEKFRIDLVSYFASQPSRYWGIGYHNGRQKDYTKYTGKEIRVKVDALAKVAKNTYLGVILDLNDMEGTKIRDISYLKGERTATTYYGGGLSFAYDSRDFIPNPYKGIYAKLEYVIYPSAIGNRNTISRSEAIFRAYKQVWEDGVIAFDAQGIFSGGTVPWNMLVLAGGSRQMRGYYEGRYRDKMFLQSQVELRQRVWRRSGVAIWAGAGNVFPKFSELKMSQTLPTFGVGYRWEFKNRVNVRLDYGIGKGETGFYFNINEAF